MNTKSVRDESEKTAPPFTHVLVVGGGMIGSSILRAARLRWGRDVTLYMLDRDKTVRSYCREKDWVDGVWAKAQENKNLTIDLVLLAIPLGGYERCLAELRDILSRGEVVLSDVGSSKRSVAKLLQAHALRNCTPIPGHPVAGIEKTGPWSGRDDLFTNRYCVLTPNEEIYATTSSLRAIERLTKFWQELGMKVEKMTPEHHDLVLSITSHLPTLIAYCLTGTAKDMENLDWEHQFFADGRPVRDNWGNINTLEVMQYAAGGFRDFTRIAASDPIMWRDVYLHNKSPVVYALDLFLQELHHLREAVLNGDGAFLEQCFRRSQQIRQGIVEMGQAGQFDATEKHPSQNSAHRSFVKPKKQ